MKIRASLHSCLNLAKRIIETISNLTGYAGMLAILAATLIITYQVFTRYWVKWPNVWVNEAAIFLIIFATFVGSAFALKNGAHVKMDIVTTWLKPEARKKLSIVVSIIALAFCVFVSIRGWQMWWEVYRLGWRSDSLWGPPLAIPYSFLLIGFTFICLQYILNISKEIRSLRSR